MTTHVINIKANNLLTFTLAIELDFTRKSILRQKWGNPYAKFLKKLGRDRVIKMYEEYIMNKPELMRLIPFELKNKRLGCWCKPLPCHGDILAELADK
jgi:Domain of unknown function (DUF4326)